MSLVRLTEGPFGTFLLVRVKGRIDRRGTIFVRVKQPPIDENRDTVLVQTDYDFPGIASTFGWKGPCHPDTDGTVTCRVCGKTPGELIASASRFLERHIGRVREDPGYLP